MGIELCGNGLDDDLDGQVDCADEDCGRAEVCLDARAPSFGQFAPLDPDSKLARVLEGDCSEHPEEFRSGAQRHDCSLLPDDCGFGMRCLTLSRDGRYLKSRCVRQGCAQPYQACESQGRADPCRRGSLCLLAPSICGAGSCCVPLCEAAKAGACSDCRALRVLFEFSERDRRLSGLGVCLAPQ